MLARYYSAICNQKQAVRKGIRWLTHWDMDSGLTSVRVDRLGRCPEGPDHEARRPCTRPKGIRGAPRVEESAGSEALDGKRLVAHCDWFGEAFQKA